MTDILNAPLWSEDHTYRLTIALNRVLPNPHTVTDQRAWYASLENRARFEINRLCCEEVCFVEGVKIKRTEAPGKQSFHVNNERGKGKDYFKRFTVGEAVARIVELVAEREANK